MAKVISAAAKRLVGRKVVNASFKRIYDQDLQMHVMACEWIELEGGLVLEPEILNDGDPHKAVAVITEAVPPLGT